MDKTTNHIEGVKLRVLILEDSRQDYELISEQLSDAGYLLELTHAENELEFNAALQENEYDLILSDFKLPGFDAFKALQITNKTCPNVPFICISGSIGEETAIELLKLGAIDYVLKDRPERLPFAVKRALDEAKEIAAHQQAAKALQESEYRFKQVSENAQEWIWEVDKSGLYTYSSPVIQSLLGYSPEEIVGRHHFYDLFAPDWKDQKKRAAFKIFTNREAFKDFDNQVVHKNGQIITLATSGSPVFNDQGDLVGYRGVDYDITERKKIIEELILAKEKAEESDKLKTAFINNISHEIRTPLNGILGFGQLLADVNLTPDQREEYYAFLSKSSNRLMNTISDYMDMARIVSGTMSVHKKEFHLQPLFQEIMEKAQQWSEEKKLDIKSDIQEGTGEIILKSDREIIRRIFSILIGNAVKFTDNGSINCGYKVIPGFVEFFVKDTGIGIGKHKINAIFELFTQEDSSMIREHEGSGLGLAIARGLVKLLGGTLSAVSEKGIGSTFSFTAPYKTPAISAKAPSSNIGEPGNKDELMVLIAEDEESNYLFMQAALEIMGYHYIHVTNGADAVEICKQKESISLVLMDIKMPVMNGIEAAQLIHASRPDLPIVAITAYAQTGDEQRFMDAGFNGYLAKPVIKEDLQTLLQKYLHPAGG